MPAPDLQQARSHHARQAAIAVAAASAIRTLFEQDAPWSQILTRLASYQLAAAVRAARTVAEWADSSEPLVDPRRFAGVSSAGFSIAEPIVVTIDRAVPAPAEALPAQWWDDAQVFMAEIEQLIASEVRDAGRSAAQAEIVARPDWQNYVRMLVPPSCKRCTVLAGRIYRDLEGFKRHPQCDCVHVPVQDWEEAHDAGMVSSPAEAFEKGHIRDLTRAERQAIEDGADIGAVVNANRGMYTADLFGRRVKATRASTTKRSAWRKAHPSLLVRLRPESIYRIADGDRAEALRLLELYGYILPSS